ncbi:MAG: GlcG/HbpS family heme-binding protein [Sphingopyxis sp.]
MISLKQAQDIVSGALAHGVAQSAKPLAIVVLDTGGHPVATARQDGASLFRHDIARSKAMGALGMGSDTRILAQRAASNPAFFQSLTAAVDGAIIFSPGGVLIRDGQGTLQGAVGISGDTGEMDEAAAQAGITLAGLEYAA